MPAFFKWRADTRGTSAVEFAILAPVFLLMLTGMLAYGLYFGAAHSLQQLAADAARTAIAGLDEKERRDLVKAYLDTVAESHPLIQRERLVETIRDKPGDEDHYRITLSYDAANLPIWSLYPPLPLPSRAIIVTATIRQGGI